MPLARGTMTRRDWIGVPELQKVTFWRDVVSEFLTTAFLLLYVTLSMVTLDRKLYQVEMTHVGLMVGLLIFLLIEGYGPVCGYMNPCVSLAACMVGRISLIRALVLTLVQCAGAIAGSYVVYLLTPLSKRAAIQAFQPNQLIMPWQGMLIELILTFNLINVGLTASDKRTHDVILPSLPTGLTVGMGIIVAGTWTGACQNPVVALGPAVVTRTFTNHWIYWVGPYGATIMAAAYNIACYKARAKEQIIDDDKSADIVKVENHIEVHSF